MKKITTTILFALVLALPTWASDFSDDSTGTTLYYNITSDNEVEVTWGRNGRTSGTEEYVGNITIPETVTYSGVTYTVTAIGDYAFYNCKSLSSITIPASVTTIGDVAFEFCSALERAELGSGVTTIGDYAFYECYSLTSIDIPDSTTTIGIVAFGLCCSLESATIGSGAKEIGWGLFSDCYSLTKLEVSEANDAYCSVDNVIFTKDMITIVAYAPGLEAETYEIPETVTTITSYAFGGACNLISIDIPDNVTTLEYGVFAECESLQSATIGNGIETIASWAFSACYALSNVTLGSNVTTIEDYVFQYCYDLERMTSLNPEPPTCTKYTFYGVDTSNITLYVPKGSKESYSSADYWSDFGAIEELAEVGDKIEVDGLCYTILSNYEAEVTYNTDENGAISPYTQTSISIPESISYGTTYKVVGAGYWAFYGCENLTSIDLGSITYIGEQAFRDCTNLSSVEFPETLTEIGDYAFSGCSALTGELTIPDNVVTLGASAFTSCSGLTAVVIGNGVETIGDSAFQYCENLTSVTFGENVVSIGGTAFASTILEGDLVIPDKVTTIGEWAFSGLTKLTSLTLGTSVETIGGSAFSNCTGLNYVTSLNTTPPTCVDNPFTYVYLSFLTLYIPIGTYDEYSTATIWEDFWRIIEMTSFAIETLPATDVTYNSATLNGSLTPAYDDPILEAGFEYWTDGGEVVTVVVDDEDLTATISGLVGDTTYTYHSYATTDSGTAYGNDVTFTTLTDTSGIGSIGLDQTEVKAIYSTSGQQLNEVQRGVNVVRYSDGSVKKIYVK